MGVLMVPPADEVPWPTLGPQVCELLEDRAVHGPGDLKGQPYKLDADKRAFIYRAYEVFPRGHARAGKRRFKRFGLSLRKGTAKTELAAAIAFAELHPEAPVRCDGWHEVDGVWQPVGAPVVDPYIPMVAYTEEQTEDLAYAALYVMCSMGSDADFFDIGLDRIVRLSEDGRADGKAVALASSPDSRDGARTTFQHFDEPLALDTEIPTTSGWKTMADIADGDFVFDRDGAAVRVLGKSPVKIDRPCFRVTFADGESVVTDAAHRWKAVEWSNRPAGEQTVTTQQMVDRGIFTGYGYRWRLPRNAGFDGVHAELPIDPYLLGMWLGDGSTDAGYIATHVDDFVEMSAGFAHTRSTARPNLVRWLPTGLRTLLRKNALLGAKHIPDGYMFSSREQRLELLRGLMDTDGHTTKGGSCTFVQGRVDLTQQVATLVRSLGAEASVVRAKDARSRTGEMCKVHFSPAFLPFRLGRKANRFEWGQRSSTSWPAIASIEPVESVPVQCLAVDSDDHLFLIGKGLHLTHNTHRFTLPRLVEAHETMLQNIPKRMKADAWSLETTTTYTPGEGSVAQGSHEDAERIDRGEIKDSTFFFFHRDAAPRADENLDDPVELADAIREASGPSIAQWDDFEGQVDSIASLYHQAKRRGNESYFERVWLNRRVQGGNKAFDSTRWIELTVDRPPVAHKSAITLGLDGSKWNDTTALVATDVVTGWQWLAGFWDPSIMQSGEVPVDEVEAVCQSMFETFNVMRMNGDPAQGFDVVLSRLESKFGGRRVVQFYTDARGLRKTAFAAKRYSTAMRSGELTHSPDRVFAEHIGASVKRPLKMLDDEGQPMWLIEKERRDSPNKIDIAMAGLLSWDARMDALALGVPEPVSSKMVGF